MSMFFRDVCIAVLVLMLSNVTIAKTVNQSPYESVLPPGARIVPGDSSKNEFFILAANDDGAQIKTLENEIATEDEDKKRTVSMSTPPLPEKQISVKTEKKPIIQPVKIIKLNPAVTVLPTKQMEKKSIKPVKVIASPVLSETKLKKVNPPSRIVEKDILDKDFNEMINKKRLSKIKLALKNVVHTSDNKVTHRQLVGKRVITINQSNGRLKFANVKKHVAIAQRHVNHRQVAAIKTHKRSSMSDQILTIRVGAYEPAHKIVNRHITYHRAVAMKTIHRKMMAKKGGRKIIASK